MARGSLSTSEVCSSVAGGEKILIKLIPYKSLSAIRSVRFVKVDFKSGILFQNQCRITMGVESAAEGAPCAFRAGSF
jgi:hypothetical protein